jgi:hypothetical protein
MDPAIIRYYRRLLREGFAYAGSFDNPSIYLTYDNSRGTLCGNVGDNLHLYINIRGGVIEKMRYLCMCDPTTNVAVEALCALAEHRTLEEAKNLKEEEFYRLTESRGEEFQKKTRIVIEYLRQEIMKFEEKQTA